MQDHEVRVGSHTVMIELGIQGGTYSIGTLIIPEESWYGNARKLDGLGGFRAC
jgi:hypothetical protein